MTVKVKSRSMQRSDAIVARAAAKRRAYLQDLKGWVDARILAHHQALLERNQAAAQKRAESDSTPSE
jgi:hypothetical protein